MSKQFIISIGREFGSGGHCIAEKIAEFYNVPLYDKGIIKDIALEKNKDLSEFEKYDEVPKNRLFTRTVNGYSNAPQEVLADMQFDFLKEKASSGESFVVVGRCANSVLKDFPCLISVFITSDIKTKSERIAKIESISVNDAKELIEKSNKRRKMYHNFYCKEKWGDSRCYDLIINSGKIGIDETAELLKVYTKARIFDK